MQRSLHETLGKPFVETEFVADSIHKEEIVIEKEEMIEMSCSSSDEEEQIMCTIPGS